MRPAFVLILALLPARAGAEGVSVDPEPPELPGSDSELDEELEVEEIGAGSVLTDAERLAQLEDKVFELEERLKVGEAKLREPEWITFSGFVDVGFFVPSDSGVGWFQDFGNEILPEYMGQFGWVFLGDILSTTINSRGEVADLGQAPGVNRFDSVGSKGAPGFIVNEVNFRLNVILGPRLLLNTSVNFAPRTGSEFALGDFFDLDIAQLEWVIDQAQTTSIFIGKMESVFGIEYKERRADARFGITPSLVQRYTSGPQLGIKIRSKLFSDWLIAAASVTNGSSTTEQFHFFNEVDTNAGKTINSRVAVRVPMSDFFGALEGHSLELGFSAELGPQDRALDNQGLTWFVGADLEYRSVDLAVKAQWIRGFSEGAALGRVWSLDLSDSGYLELSYMLLPEIGLLFRGELRDAFVSLGSERAYITKSFRLTGGLRVVFSDQIFAKLEYLHNGEFAEVPEFGNDVFTSSLVLRY